MDMVVQVLSPENGVMYTQVSVVITMVYTANAHRQVTSQGNRVSSALYNKQLQKLKYSVDYQSEAVPVPSYMERCV